VLTSISDTEGLLSSGAAAKRAKTPAADTGSNADALGASKRLAATMAALNPSDFFIKFISYTRWRIEGQDSRFS
jgi:hypothetical protein